MCTQRKQMIIGEHYLNVAIGGIFLLYEVLVVGVIQLPVKQFVTHLYIIWL